MVSNDISACLGKTGLCVWPNFLSPESLRDTFDDLNQCQSSEAFTRAGTGQAHTVSSVRRDKTHWLDRETASLVQSHLWKKLDALKLAFNRNLFLGISHFDGHYSSYPKGGFYRRHLDCFHEDDSRIVSFVLYLNQAWKSGDGGHLRIYAKDSHEDIAPIGGTMVCFLSRDTEHEVMESHTNRFSFTGWFKTD